MQPELFQNLVRVTAGAGIGLSVSAEVLALV